MKALVADDDPIQRLLLHRALADWGYEVLVAQDGLAAWEILRAPDAPDLAILDWMMPGLEGQEVCRRVRGLGREKYAYLILLTYRTDRCDMLEGLEAGADDYVNKPFDPAELKARLNTGRRILRLQSDLIAAREAMRQRAARDSLTGIWNHAAILEILDRELVRARRDGRPLAVVLSDLDHFKRVNDAHGHQAGDAVLRGFVERAQAAIRPYDLMGRCGGEEFLLVLPGCDEAAALAVCERIRARFAAEPFPFGEAAILATVSLGAAVCHGRGDAAGLVRMADSALYRAKAAGRNRAEIHQP